MPLSWPFRRRSAALAAKPEEAYLAEVARRLLLSSRRRADCLAELGDHLAQRAASAQFRSVGEVEARMGSPRMVATQLNAAAPWLQSRPSWRLYAAALGLLALLITSIFGMFDWIARAYPNGQDNHGTFLLCNYVVIPAFFLSMPALVALLARRWCVRPLQAAVPVCLLLLMRMWDTTWAGWLWLMSACGSHLDPAVAGPGSSSLFEMRVMGDLLGCMVYAGPCALLLSLLGKRSLARWTVPALLLSVATTALCGWLEHTHVEGLPMLVMWAQILGATLGVAFIAALIRRGELRAA